MADTGLRWRWLAAGAGALALIAAAVWWLWPAPPAVAGDESRHPSRFKQAVREAVEQGREEEWFVLLGFEKEDGMHFSQDPWDWFDREVWPVLSGQGDFATRVRFFPVQWGGRFMRYHLPESLQWLGYVEGGPAVAAIEAAGDDYDGDKYQAKLDQMAALVLCGYDGRPIGYWHLPTRKDAQAANELLEDLSAKVQIGRDLQAALERAKQLDGVARARVLAEALQLLGWEICAACYGDELEFVAATEGEDASELRSWSRLTLRKGRHEANKLKVMDAFGMHWGSVTPHGARRVLGPLRQEYADDLEFLQFMAMIEAIVGIPHVVNGQYDQVLKDLEKALALAPDSLLAPDIVAHIEQLKKL